MTHRTIPRFTIARLLIAPITTALLLLWGNVAPARAGDLHGDRNLVEGVEREADRGAGRVTEQYMHELDRIQESQLPSSIRTDLRRFDEDLERARILGQQSAQPAAGQLAPSRLPTAELLTRPPGLYGYDLPTPAQAMYRQILLAVEGRDRALAELASIPDEKQRESRRQEILSRFQQNLAWILSSYQVEHGNHENTKGTKGR